MSDVANADQLTLPSGQVVELGESKPKANAASPYEERRRVIDEFPGQKEKCPVCGSMATQAPEGIHGYHVPVDETHNHGDAVWQNEHCFKCGYRSGASSVVKQAEMWGMFQEWLRSSTQADMQHKTLNPPSSTDDMKNLQDLATRLGVTISPTSSEV